MFKFLIVALTLSMVGVASAATPYRLVGAIVVVDQNSLSVNSVGVNIPAETLAVCNAAKTAIVGTNFSDGNYDKRASMQRTYNLICVNTRATPAP